MSSSSVRKELKLTAYITYFSSVMVSAISYYICK